MNLKTQLQQELAGSQLFTLGERMIELSDPPATLRCELTALDSLACAFKRLAVSSERLQRLSPEQLRAAAERLCARLTYLLEPVSVIETDAHGCVVQMRSDPPQKESDRTSYYELLLAREGEVSLARYARDGRNARQPIDAHVTREVLVRLAGDLSEAA